MPGGAAILIYDNGDLGPLCPKLHQQLPRTAALRHKHRRADKLSDRQLTAGGILDQSEHILDVQDPDDLIQIPMVDRAGREKPFSRACGITSQTS